jgi:hypothetical protein
MNSLPKKFYHIARLIKLKTIIAIKRSTIDITTRLIVSLDDPVAAIIPATMSATIPPIAA